MWPLIVLVALIIVGIIFLPWVVIWAISTLIGTAIPFNFWTWLAVVVVWMFISSAAAVGG